MRIYTAGRLYPDAFRAEALDASSDETSQRKRRPITINDDRVRVNARYIYPPEMPRVARSTGISECHVLFPFPSFLPAQLA